MYKFYTIVTAALVASSLTGVASPRASIAARHAVMRGQSEKTVPSGETGVVRIGDRTYRLDESAPMTAPMSRADETELPDGKADITLDEILTEAPAGKDTQYIRDCFGWWSQFSSMFQMQDLGGAAHIITNTGDGYVYMDNPVSGFPLDAWVRGTINSDGSEITFTGAQKVCVESYAGNEFNYYTLPLEFVVTNQEQGTGWFYPTKDQTYTLELKDGNYVSKTNDLIFGLCQLQDDGTFRWMGYGDYAINMTPQTEKTPGFPAGVTPEQWTIKYDGGAHFAQVAVSGDKIYVKGILPDILDGVAEGTIKDGKAVFTVGQYLGENSNHHYAYLYGSTVKSAWNDYYGDYVMTTFATRDASFDYIPAEKLINGCVGLSTSTSRATDDVKDDYIPVASAIANVSAQYLVRDIKTPPAKATGITFFAFSDQYQYGYVNFSFSNLDEKGCLLDENRLYYCVYFDFNDSNREVFDFMPDEYASLTEPTNLIPYNYSDYFDFDATGYAHTFYYYVDGLDTIGIQTVYNNEEDVLFASNVVVFPVTNRIDSRFDTELTVKDVTYFDLQGRQVANPCAGIYVKRTTYSDGTSTTVKTIIK